MRMAGAVGVGAALLLSVGAPAWGQDEPGETDARARMTDALSRLHRLNQLGIKWGEVGRAAQLRQVRELAAQLVREHRRNDRRLLQLARERNLTLTNAAPMGQMPPDLKWRAELHRLRVYRGGDFDGRFLSGLTGMQEEALATVSGWRAQPADAELGELLDATWEQLSAQLADARRLRTRSAPAARWAPPVR